MTGWTDLNSSSIALADLRFGDFNGDGITDIMKRNGGYQISLGGVSSWQNWSTLNDDSASFLIGDVDGAPGDDFIRYVAVSDTVGRWEVSSGGRYAWTTLATKSWPSEYGPMRPARFVRALAGRFRGLAKDDVLAIDFTRWGQVAGNGSSTFLGHSRHPY